MALPREVDVVIIGAGASGIAAIHQILGSNLTFICLEGRERLGGAWVYNDDVPPCEISFDGDGRPLALPPDGVAPPTPIYAGLTTNIPMDLMAYHDFRFDDRKQMTFPTHPHVLRYLEDSGQDCLPYIHFSVLVKSVGHTVGNHRRWKVETTRTNKLGDSDDISCDFVLVANGHYTVPSLPYIEGLWRWPRKVLHAQYYRHSQNYDGLSLAIIGIGPSGYDICREIAARRFHRGDLSKLYSVASHPSTRGWDWNDPNAPEWVSAITPTPRITSVDSDGSLHLADKSIIQDVDVLIFATGYHYSFPFCNAKDAPWSTSPLTRTPPVPEGALRPGPDSRFPVGTFPRGSGARVHCLDSLQMFYLPDPSFAFLVLQTSVVPFPLAEYQARAICAWWSGRANFVLEPPENEELEQRSVHQRSDAGGIGLANQLLEKIGEGGNEGEGVEERGNWSNVPEWRRERYENSAELRKEVLGY